MTWDLSCPDWAERLQSGRSLVPALPFNKREGERAAAVFDKLRLADVPGTPTMGEAGGEWFRDIVRALYGSMDPVTRARRIRELFLLVPKKNSKTTNGALLMLTALLLNQRPQANFMMTAPVQDVAEIAFNAAAGAIRLDPVLEKKLHIRDHVKTIIHRETKAMLQIMTFDPAVLTGQKVSGGALIDELHVVATMAKASSAIRQLRGGMMPYPDAFLAFITTQSELPPSGVFRAELQKAREIRDGKRAGAMLPVLYEFPREMQRQEQAWRDTTRWAMVTPNNGRSITVERLEEESRVAESTGPEEFRAWASQHLNIEIGLALMSDRWAGADYWQAQERPGITLDAILQGCELIDVGIDGGGLDDLLGLAVLGRTASGEWHLWCKAWAHPCVLERRKSEAERFRSFAQDGDLVLVERIGDDTEQVAELVASVQAAGLLDKVGVDPYGIGGILDAITAAGVPQEKVVAISQGWKLGGAIKTTERRLAEGQLHVAASEMMRWVVGNAKVEPKGNSILITKQASGTAKIDPLMAAFDAVSLMALNPHNTFDVEALIA